MNKKTGLIIALFAIVATMVFTSCEDDVDDNVVVTTYDCTELELNFGETCYTGVDNILGVVDDSCFCAVDDTTVVATYDCPDMQANYGDACDNPSGQNGYIDQACNCVVDSMEYDCEFLQLNYNDTCMIAGMVGIVDESCLCTAGNAFDCPGLLGNIGDPCQGGWGVISEDCECIEDNNWDCDSLQVNVGATCVTISGDVGFINVDCECESNTGVWDCPDLQLNYQDSCYTPAGNLGLVNFNCECD